MSWAPDGQHLLLDHGLLEVLDANGATVATPGGRLATWVDSRQFATWSSSSASATLGSVTVHGIDGSSTNVPGMFQGRGFIGNGVGGLALTLPGSGIATGPDHFVIWINGVLGDPVTGWPLGWSNDGTRLIVATSQPTGGTAGSVQAVSIGSMSSPFTGSSNLIANVAVDPSYAPVFNMSGSEVAFSCAAVGVRSGCEQLVVNLPAGSAHEVGTQPPGLPLTWLTNDELLLAADGATGSGSLRVWNGVAVFDAALPPASWALAGSSGYVALVTEAVDGSHATRIIDPSGAPIANLPGMAVAWSEDGSSVAVRTDSGQQIALISVQ